MRTPREYLEDIVEQIQRIERFTSSGQESFLNNEETQYAVMLAYIIIGEAAKNLPDELLNTQSQIDWRRIKGFRDFLIHNYHKVNSSRIWEAVEDLPNLKTAIETLLNETKNGETDFD